ncbi:dihydrolipoyl dehydrogenase [Natrarchaeobius chitinivorans]|uniref:Dihydrolipoyl dehydrogenase n=1 Tax=Natrarchaeobius chitinivorans TaxID=1679083 RepID=A0A3N6MKR3_NATCH|nr:dihydrolipoyl dehydrogenase [Natrarchaeobius chitinivorans]RQG94886.1 dihydrolipoyl dehydrogenase [Natrarchaeobius chitinivorans]
MTEHDYDEESETELAIIGAGPAGYVAAIRAGQLGMDVTLVERDGFGGTCLNHGCIPSKALIHAADVAESARTADDIGIYTDVDVNFDEIQRWKDRIVRRLTKGVEKLCTSNGVNLLEGEATFAGSDAVVVRNRDGDRTRVSFDDAIVATGSRPIEIPGLEYDGESILDSKAVLGMEELPEDLVVIGAGYIGMELSMALAKLGVSVTVVEELDGILPTYDDDLVRPVESQAAELGIEFEFGKRAVDGTIDDDGSVTLQLSAPDEPAAEPESVTSEKVLVAVGREPVTDSLELENAGVSVDSRGFIETTDGFRTEQENVYAVGDVAGEPLLAHAGSEEGKLVAESIAGSEPVQSIETIPAAVFTDPEIATVGLSESEAADRGYDPVVGSYSFRVNGRALTADSANGAITIVADESTGRILGGQIVGDTASELIAEVGLAVANELTVADLVNTVHSHPTLSEGIVEAALDTEGAGIHML